MKFPQNAQFCTGHFLKKIKTKIVINSRYICICCASLGPNRMGYKLSRDLSWRDGGHLISALHVWFRFYVPFFFLLTTFTVVD